ncbi:MAG TPA: ABC transporter ATP-binding protein [Caldilineaceae bacterium]|nr:ABC transporter ATP-binding protein [Caldilineaceae bacterium]
MIQTIRLTRHFGDITAVSDLTLDVQPGEIFGMLGHNGAGKTTTVRLLNGLLEPTAGSLRVLGLDPVAEGPALRRRTGVLTETPSLDERLSATDNLVFYAAMFGVPARERARRVAELLETFGLADRSQERVAGFSKGMKQRLALARALLHNPDLLFLDEPAAGLDPVATRQLHELILRLSREEGKTVFLCTHNLTEAQRLCQRVAVLQQGRLLALGTPAALARQVAPEVQLRIEVDPEQVAQAAAALAPLHTGEVQREPAALVIAGVTRERIPAVVAALVAAGTRLYRVDYTEASLEDVYFALHADEMGG